MAVLVEERINRMIALPKPRLSGLNSLEETIGKRRSVRRFIDKPLSSDQLSQLLWAAQGITDESGDLRAAPSAGAVYPIELYVATCDGFFHYLPRDHALETLLDNDIRSALASAAYNQDYIATAAATFIICAAYPRISLHYGDRGTRYVDMEAGHIAQNVLLQATSLGLGGVPVGAFTLRDMQDVLRIDLSLEPIYLIPTGYF